MAQFMRPAIFSKSSCMVKHLKVRNLMSMTRKKYSPVSISYTVPTSFRLQPVRGLACSPLLSRAPVATLGLRPHPRPLLPFRRSSCPDLSARRASTMNLHRKTKSVTCLPNSFHRSCFHRYSPLFGTSTNQPPLTNYKQSRDRGTLLADSAAGAPQQKQAEQGWTDTGGLVKTQPCRTSAQQMHAKSDNFNPKTCMACCGGCCPPCGCGCCNCPWPGGCAPPGFCNTGCVPLGGPCAPGGPCGPVCTGGGGPCGPNPCGPCPCGPCGCGPCRCGPCGCGPCGCGCCGPFGPCCSVCNPYPNADPNASNAMQNCFPCPQAYNPQQQQHHQQQLQQQQQQQQQPQQITQQPGKK